eukprot:jgi/Bigna1/88302/estExt_fgenesh1_pg.C_300109
MLAADFSQELTSRYLRKLDHGMKRRKLELSPKKVEANAKPQVYRLIAPEGLFCHSEEVKFAGLYVGVPDTRPCACGRSRYTKIGGGMNIFYGNSKQQWIVGADISTDEGYLFADSFAMTPGDVYSGWTFWDEEKDNWSTEKYIRVVRAGEFYDGEVTGDPCEVFKGCAGPCIDTKILSLHIQSKEYADDSDSEADTSSQPASHTSWSSPQLPRRVIGSNNVDLRNGDQKTDMMKIDESLELVTKLKAIQKRKANLAEQIPILAGKGSRKRKIENVVENVNKIKTRKGREHLLRLLACETFVWCGRSEKCLRQNKHPGHCRSYEIFDGERDMLMKLSNKLEPKKIELSNENLKEKLEQVPLKQAMSAAVPQNTPSNEPCIPSSSIHCKSHCKPPIHPNAPAGISTRPLAKRSLDILATIPLASKNIPTSACDQCGNAQGEKRKCSGCQSAYYCNWDCQRVHWPTHRHHCLENVHVKGKAGKIVERFFKEEAKTKPELKPASKEENCKIGDFSPAHLCPARAVALHLLDEHRKDLAASQQILNESNPSRSKH